MEKHSYRLFRVVKNAALFLGCLISLSCAGNREIPLADARILSGKTAVQTLREKPGFMAATPGKAAIGAFGAIGGVVSANMMISSGNEIVRENQIEDPAVWISKELASRIQKKHGIRFAGERRVTEDKPDEIAKACAGADYALDVRTVFWSFSYFPVNWDTYRVAYAAKLRLIDCKTGKAIAEGYYARSTDPNDRSLSYDTLVENGAVGLKRELKIGAAQALGYFGKNILGL